MHLDQPPLLPARTGQSALPAATRQKQWKQMSQNDGGRQVDSYYQQQHLHPPPDTRLLHIRRTWNGNCRQSLPLKESCHHQRLSSCAKGALFYMQLFPLAWKLATKLILQFMRSTFNAVSLFKSWPTFSCFDFSHKQTTNRVRVKAAIMQMPWEKSDGAAGGRMIGGRRRKFSLLRRIMRGCTVGDSRGPYCHMPFQLLCVRLLSF